MHVFKIHSQSLGPWIKEQNETHSLEKPLCCWELEFRDFGGLLLRNAYEVDIRNSRLGFVLRLPGFSNLCFCAFTER